MRSVLVLLVLAALTLPLGPWTAVSFAQASRPAVGRDTVVVASSQEPDSLNPLFLEMAASQEIANTLYASDVQRDHTWKLSPEGAMKIPNLRDGDWVVSGQTMTVRWDLKSRKWSDGRAVSCADYVFTHSVARNEQVPVVVRDITKRIANVSCPAGATGRRIVVNWRELYPFANLSPTEYGALPRHVIEPMYRANPTKLNEAPFGNDPSRTITDGAYRLSEWQRGSSVTVVANPQYFEGAPRNIRRIIFRLIPDTNAIVANILSGAVDAVGEIGITFDQAVQLERQAQGRGIKVFYTEGLIWEHIDFNFDNPLLADVRVRRAITHAINRDVIVQQLFDGKQPVAHTYLPPKHPGYAQNAQRYPFDQARARALLQEAGFTPGPDGILRNAAGQKLSLELNTTAGNRVREQVEQIIQQQLRQIGIEITIQNFPARVYFGEITNQRKFKALAMYAWLFDPTSGCDAFYTSDGIPNESNGWSGQNYPGYKNADMDRVCKAASRELDEAKRNSFLQDSARFFARDLPALPLYYRVSVSAVKEGLADVWNPTGLSGIYESYNAHRWAWKQ